MAALLQTRGNFAEAETLYQRLWESAQKTLPPDDPGIVGALNGLAWNSVVWGRQLQSHGDEASARVPWEEAANLLRPVMGQLDKLSDLDTTRAAALLHLGQADEARPIVEKLLAAGWDDPDFLALRRASSLLPPEESAAVSQNPHERAAAAIQGPVLSALESAPAQ